MSVPGWWSFALLAAAAWRCFQLLARDDILDLGDLRARALRYRGWTGQGDAPAGYRAKWAEFITCPYCAGFWIVVVWWVAWQITPFWTEVVAVPWAASAALIGLDKILSSED